MGKLPSTYSIKVSEMTLSGNEEIQFMIWSKVQFKGTDDDFLDLTGLPKDKSKNLISLEPSRIRMFLFDYNHYDTSPKAEII